jgi:hypothetical protein
MKECFFIDTAMERRDLTLLRIVCNMELLVFGAAMIFLNVSAIC